MYGFVNSAPLSSASFAGKALVARDVVCQRAAPASVSMSSSKMSKSVPFLLKPKNLEGLPASYEFDPLLLSDYVPVAFLQEAEIKHGRICMLAVLGFLVQEQFTFGGSYFPHMLPVDAHDFYIKTGGMGQILFFISAFEFISVYALKATVEGKRAPGDFGFDPLGLGKEPAAFKKYQGNEIQNGRLAMIAIGGLIHQEWISKLGAVDQLTHFQTLPELLK